MGMEYCRDGMGMGMRMGLEYLEDGSKLLGEDNDHVIRNNSAIHIVLNHGTHNHRRTFTLLLLQSGGDGDGDGNGDGDGGDGDRYGKEMVMVMVVEMASERPTGQVRE